MNPNPERDLGVCPQCQTPVPAWTLAFSFYQHLYEHVYDRPDRPMSGVPSKVFFCVRAPHAVPNRASRDRVGTQCPSGVGRKNGRSTPPPKSKLASPST